MTLTIRPATVADAGILGGLHLTTWNETYPGLLGAAELRSHSHASRRAMWDSILSHPRPPRVLIAEESEPCGFAALRGQDDGELLALGYDGEIAALYLLARAQGRGIGRRLFAAGRAALCEAGRSNHALWVLEGNHRAIGFYRAMGGSVVLRRRTRSETGERVELALGWPLSDPATPKAGQS
ncbi:GNAT family N-acetyltransferase [Halodurantibacterium flavum]|uniref:GNAT family N-acetyltransferase n=1 Tax=Halodurantibacterium flavum TaxID=1382802 RepID=A0ABW4S3Z7_9RHOB